MKKYLDTFTGTATGISLKFKLLLVLLGRLGHTRVLGDLQQGWQGYQVHYCWQYGKITPGTSILVLGGFGWERGAAGRSHTATAPLHEI